MKKITLFFIMFGFFLTASAQYNFNPIVGPTNVAAGAPVTINLNDAANVAGVTAPSSGSYNAFLITVEWAQGGGNPWSSEADVTVTTTAGSLTIDPPTTGGQFSNANTTLTFEGDLPGLYDPTSDGYIDLVFNQSFGGSNADWSNIVITLFETPTCLEPSGMTSSGVTSTDAVLDWTIGNTETEWNIEYNSGADFTPGNGEEENAVPVTGTPNTTLTGLTPATTYYVYYQANCGTSDLSLWIGPFIFDTECVTFTAPYTEDFENAGAIPLCWAMDGGEDWFFDNDPAGEHIGDDGVISGVTASNGFFAWCDSSGNEGPRTLTSPLIDVSGLMVPALSFYEISDNEDNANSTLEVEVWDGAAWNLVETFNTNTNGWELKIIGLSGLTITGDIQVRFRFSETVTGDFYDDIAIDDVMIDEAPGCIPPGGVTFANITGTSADISWSSNNGETSWEYVVSDGGTGEPTGPGTTTGSNAITESGLEFTSTYEFWVRADCGGAGFSDWAGPFTFSTPIQTDFTLDCVNDGPLTIDYCYESDGEDTPFIYTFTSNDGTSLNLNFNSGFVEINWDELVVLDSDGTPFPGYEPGAPGFGNGNFGNAGDISGLTFQSTGDTISYYINSDGSLSCGSGSDPMADGINFTVSCATCVNPVATYAVIDDCDNGDQFLIDVDITSLGDASALTISNNINADTTPVTATGVYQIGPFPFLVDVIVSVSNDDDANCIINSAAIQLLACPPDNDNPCDAIVAFVNPDEACDTVNPGTILAATPSGIPIGTCGGTPNDDVWFEFTAIGDQQVIDIQNIVGGTPNIDHALYEGTCDGLIEVYCSDDNSSLTPALVIGNTYFIRVFSAGNDAETSTFDLCISTFNPTFCFDALPICADPSIEYPSIVGDQIAPPFLDYNCLGSQPDPQWNTIVFDEAGDYTFSLDQTNAAGGALDIDFIVWGPFVDQQSSCSQLITENIVDCSFSATASETITLNGVPANSTYIILITNFSQQEGSYTFVQDTGPVDGTNCSVVCDVVMEIEGAPVEDDVVDPGTPDEIFNYCGFPSVLLEASTFYDVDEYVWYKDGFVIENYDMPTLTVTMSGTYQVQVLGGICDQSEDYFSAFIEINLYEDSAAIATQNITVCDGPGSDGLEDFDLDALSASLGLGADFTITYYTNTMDANQAIGALPSPHNSAGETLIMRIEDTAASNDGYLGCRQLVDLELVVNPRPMANQPADFLVCDDSDGTVDGITEIDLVSFNAEVSTATDVEITYHESQDDADNDAGALTSPHTSDGETIFIRVENTVTGCYETTSFNIEVNIIPLAEFDTVSYDYEVCPNATVPVEIGLIPTNFTAGEVSIQWFLDDVLIPGESGLIVSSVLNAGEYRAEITFNDTGCANDAISAPVMELESCIFPQGISPNGDEFNQRFDLSSFDVTKLEIFNRNGTLVYSKTNYTDEWVGQTNDGGELPVGTYFYTMQYEGGTKMRSAWIYINK